MTTLRPERVDILNERVNTVGEIENECEKQEQKHLFYHLFGIVLQTDKIVVNNVLQSYRQSKQKLQSIFMFAPSILILFQMVMFLFPFFFAIALIQYKFIENC